MFLFYALPERQYVRTSGSLNYFTKYVCVSKYTCTRNELDIAGCINTHWVTCSVFLEHWLYLSGMATEMKLQIEIH